MIYRVPDHIHARSVHDEIVILDVRADRYLGLNGTAAVVWSVLGGGGSVADAVAELMARYDVTCEVAESDVAALLAELVQLGIISLAAP